MRNRISRLTLPSPPITVLVICTVPPSPVCQVVEQLLAPAGKLSKILKCENLNVRMCIYLPDVDIATTKGSLCVKDVSPRVAARLVRSVLGPDILERISKGVRLEWIVSAKECSEEIEWVGWMEVLLGVVVV